MLELRRGADCTGGPVIDSAAFCNDDSCPTVSGGRRSQILQRLDAGEYLVAVDGGDASAAGPFQLRFQHAVCADAVVLDGSGTFRGTTALGTDGAAPSCGIAGAPRQVFAFGLCQASTVTADTCGTAATTDTVLALASDGCDATSEVACDDDSGCGLGASRVEWSLPQGLHFLIVAGKALVPGGDFIVNLTIVPP